MSILNKSNKVPCFVIEKWGTLFMKNYLISENIFYYY